MAFLMTFAAQAESCKDQAWTKEEADTQGGGFFWIPDRFSDKDQYKASTVAKTTALVRFMEKCGVVLPRTLAFNEFCTEKPGFFDDGKYTIYLRLTYTRADCNLSRQLTQARDMKGIAKYMDRSLYRIIQDCEEIIGKKILPKMIQSDRKVPKKKEPEAPKELEEQSGTDD